VDLRAVLNDMEKRTVLTLPGLGLRPLGRPVRNQSIYRLRPSIAILINNKYNFYLNCTQDLPQTNFIIDAVCNLK
jgi:hypothetical protein